MLADRLRDVIGNREVFAGYRRNAHDNCKVASPHSEFGIPAGIRSLGGSDPRCSRFYLPDRCAPLPALRSRCKLPRYPPKRAHPKRDLTAARLFLRLALFASSGIRPRVINVDGHPAYPRAITELKHSSEPSRSCRCRTSPYLNNLIEYDHRFIKKRITVRKGQIRWLAKGDAVGQRQFIHMFGIAQ